MADSSNREVKKNNRIRTLRAVLAGGRISQPALAAELGHSGPTVLSNIRELIQLGLVEEIGVFDSTGGRRAKAFGPVADARLSIGLEITKSHIGLVAVDLTGSLEAYRRQEMAFSMSDAYFQQLAQRLEQFIQNEELAPQRLLGVGISLPGIVDERERLLTDSHVLQLKDVSTDCFSRCLPYSCRFINDANAAGLAEVYQQEELKNLVYLSLSDSVGGAILIDGRLYAGDHRRAGELGHNTLVPNGRPCYCGKLGCLDSYCNAQILSGMTGGSLDNWEPCFDYFTKLMENEPMFPKQDATAKLMKGEIGILVCADFTGYTCKYNEMAPVEVVLPAEGYIRIPYTMSLVKNAPHEENGKALIDYCMSDEGQRLFAEGFVRPVKEDALTDDLKEKFLPDEAYANVIDLDYEAMANVQDDFMDAWVTRIYDGSVDYDS